MINFLRRIRRELINENKTSKYVIYAVGEVVLVVFGILIALGINNWNDQKKQTKSEFIYYCRILDDFELDKKRIEELLDKTNERIAISKTILLDLDSGTKDKSYLLNQFLPATRSASFVPRKVTFQDLVSSGNLRLLNDVTIKNSLIQYYSELDSKLYQLKRNLDTNINEKFDLITLFDFGLQEFNYINKLLGPEIIQTLPHEDWTKDKSSEMFKKFQLILVFNIAMADRERVHLSAINSLMELPYQLLLTKCKNQGE